MDRMVLSPSNVVHGENAMIFDNVDGMLQMVARLLQDQELCMKLGAAAYPLTGQDLWDKIGDTAFGVAGAVCARS